MTALKELTRFWANITTGSNFTAPELAAHIKLNLDRVLTGNMDRESFERRVFDFTNLAELPIGHLQDQRVHMPDDLAAELLVGTPETLSMQLSNMLCSTHPEGPEQVAEALELHTFYDAQLLLEAHLTDPEFARLCLTGWHGIAFPLLADRIEKRPELRDTFISTAIYYGALQHQIIGSRLRAISEFRFTVDDGELTDTMGATVNDFRQLFASLDKANVGVNSDKKLLGRKPDLITLMEPIAQNVLSEAYRQRPQLTEEALLAELRDLYGTLWPFIEDLSKNLIEIPDEAEEIGGGKRRSANDKKANVKLDLAELREQVPTALSGGVTAGQQLAFASLRLHAFAKRLRRLINGGGQLPLDRKGWFAPLASRKDPDVAKLVLVSTAAVWGRTQNHPVFQTDGNPSDLQSILDNSAGTPNEDLLKETKKIATKWPCSETPISESDNLRGAQTWDIIPEFHFARLTSARLTPRERNLGYEVGKHQISPQYRAAKKSHRVC